MGMLRTEGLMLGGGVKSYILDSQGLRIGDAIAMQFDQSVLALQRPQEDKP